MKIDYGQSCETANRVESVDGEEKSRLTFKALSLRTGNISFDASSSATTNFSYLKKLINKFIYAKGPD